METFAPYAPARPLVYLVDLDIPTSAYLIDKQLLLHDSNAITISNDNTSCKHNNTVSFTERLKTHVHITDSLYSTLPKQLTSQQPHNMLFAARIARPVAFRAAAPAYIRPFSQAQQLRLKEDANRSPEETERVKQEQLQKQKEGKGHWHEELASSSESHIAADKENINNHDEHINDLQKETAQQTQKNHPDAKK